MPEDLPVESASGPAQPSAQARASLLATLMLSASSVAGIMASIVRLKVVAVVLGPAGVGLLGQLGTFMGLVATIVGLGAGQSGVQSVAVARGEGPTSLARTASALVWASHGLGVLGGLLVFVLPVGHVIGPEGDAFVPWLALGVWASVASVGHLALINGLGRLRLLAGLGVAGAVLSTTAILLAIRAGAAAGIAASLAAPPLASLALAAWTGRTALAPARAWREWRAPLGPMFRVGVAFMGAALLGTAMHFVTRVLVDRSLGADAAGLYHASWSVAGLYLSFLLGALGAEYYPRISALSTDAKALGKAVQAQTRLVVHLVVPFILGALIVSPLVIHVLYDARFLPMLPMLRAQLVGDVLKVASWSLAFSLMATRRQGAYFLVEAVFTVAYTAAVAFVVPALGLAAAGWAYAGSYLVYLAAVATFVRKDVPGLGALLLLVSVYTVACSLVAWACASAALGVWAAGCAFAVGVGAAALTTVWRQAEVQLDRLPVIGRLARLRRGRDTPHPPG